MTPEGPARKPSRDSVTGAAHAGARIAARRGMRPISGTRVESSYSGIVWNPANRLQVLPQVLEVFGVRAARRQTPSGARVMALGASSTSK